MAATTLDVPRRVFADARSGRVLFVSHCLLNQNVRHLGGATRPGALPDATCAVGTSTSPLVEYDLIAEITDDQRYGRTRSVCHRAGSGSARGSV